MRAVMVAALGLALAAPAVASANGFVEDVRVLQEWHGTPGGNFGWAVSELEDIDHDGVTDVIVGEPSTNTTWVFSARTGRTLHRFDGAAGFSIADAGDTDRDGVHDVISGTQTQRAAVLGPDREVAAHVHRRGLRLLRVQRGGHEPRRLRRRGHRRDERGRGRHLLRPLVPAAAAAEGRSVRLGARHESGHPDARADRRRERAAGEGLRAVRELPAAVSGTARGRVRPSGTSSWRAWAASTATCSRTSTSVTTARPAATAGRACIRAATGR